MSDSRTLVHVSADVADVCLADKLLRYLNQTLHKARLSENGSIVMVWEVADLDQLNAFLRDLVLSG